MDWWMGGWVDRCMERQVYKTGIWEWEAIRPDFSTPLGMHLTETQSLVWPGPQYTLWAPRKKTHKKFLLSRGFDSVSLLLQNEVLAQKSLPKVERASFSTSGPRTGRTPVVRRVTVTQWVPSPWLCQPRSPCGQQRKTCSMSSLGPPRIPLGSWGFEPKWIWTDWIWNVSELYLETLIGPDRGISSCPWASYWFPLGCQDF